MHDILHLEALPWCGAAAIRYLDNSGNSARFIERLLVPDKIKQITCYSSGQIISSLQIRYPQLDKSLNWEIIPNNGYN